MNTASGKLPLSLTVDWCRWACVAALLVVSFGLSSGCRSFHYDPSLRLATIASLGNDEIVSVERRNENQIGRWRNWWVQPEAPSERTALLLRRYDLEDIYRSRPDEVIQWLHELVQNQPSMEEVHALAELSEKQARWSRLNGDKKRATRLYATSIIHAYRFLFADDLNLSRNAYDPQFRSICDVYNRSLEGLLREVCLHENFASGYRTIVGEEDRGIELEVRVEGRWKDQVFDRFELVNDFQTEGFKNQHHTYGLGAPLIAIRKKQPVDLPSEKYYPPNLTLPMTAFLHLDAVGDPQSQAEANVASTMGPQAPRRAVLSLYDPLEQTVIRTKGKVVPLESDITTPLAYGLRDPLINKGVIATASLLGLELEERPFGMFMLEPFDPNKIPVIMVHGIWSSPTTWAHMFNDLRANPEIHDNYQFWFYAYPTSQPFWLSAQQLRGDLSAIRKELDPTRRIPTLDQMIFVGHSMGGLVSSLQTMDSEDQFWSIVSSQSIDKFEGDMATMEEIRETFFFDPNSSIDRVITIATPFQGSDFANSATRWVGQKLITLPSLVTNDYQKIAKQNSDLINDPSFLTTTTSVDSLSKDCAIFPVMANAKRSEDVVTHNIIGRMAKQTFLASRFASDNQGSDGVVDVGSAKLPGAKSEIYVDEEHQKVHQHPGCILEVRRILLENLAERDRVLARPIPVINSLSTGS